MQHLDNTTRKAARSIRKIRLGYIVALSLIAISIFSEYALTEIALSREDGHAQLINIAGRQRMLSQRIMLEKMLLSKGEGKLESLRADVAELAREHAFLKQQMTDNESQAALQQLDHAITWFAKVEQLDLTQSSALTLEVKAKSHEFLRQMDALVTNYSANSDANLNTLRWSKQWLTVAALLMLLLEAKLLFSPLLRRAKRHLAELTKAYTTLKSTNDIVLRQSNELRQAVETERHTSAQLRRTEARFRGVFEQAAEGILVTNLASQVILNVNSSMLKALGLPAQEVEDGRLLDLSPRLQPSGKRSIEVWQSVTESLTETGRASFE